METITLANFENLCVEMFKQKVKVDVLEAEMKAEEDKLKDMKTRIQSFMEANEKDKHHVKGHGLIYMEDRFTVPTPKTIEDKKAFFKHLQQKGIFFEMASINSQTLNSFYKTEMDAAIARGEADFALPGIGEPSHVTKLKLRKG